MATKLTNAVTAVISNGLSLTNRIEGGNYRLTAIQTPAAWTAAVLTFQGSPDGVTFTDLYDQYGTEVNFACSTSRSISVDPTLFAGYPFFKIRSGTTGSPVTQGADRTLILSLNALVA